MSDWISVDKASPKDGQVCKSRIAGEEGYCGSSNYCTTTATFRTYEDHRNREVITVWKHNEWAALETEESQ